MAQLTDETPSVPADAGEILGLVFDFSNVAEVMAGESLHTPTVPNVSGVTIASVAITSADKSGVPSGQGVQCFCTFATAGTYTINAYAVTSSGAKRRRGVTVVVF